MTTEEKTFTHAQVVENALKAHEQTCIERQNRTDERFDKLEKKLAENTAKLGKFEKIIYVAIGALLVLDLGTVVKLFTSLLG